MPTGIPHHSVMGFPTNVLGIKMGKSWERAWERGNWRNCFEHFSHTSSQSLNYVDTACYVPRITHFWLKEMVENWIFFPTHCVYLRIWHTKYMEFRWLELRHQWMWSYSIQYTQFQTILSQILSLPSDSPVINRQVGSCKDHGSCTNS